MVIVRDKDFCMEKIAASGQCFRMNRAADGGWQIVAGDRLLRAYELGAEETEGSGLEPGFGGRLLCTEEEYRDFWSGYFDMDADYAAYREAVDPSDLFLTAASEEGRGIRILRQDPWEMLITFIISQRKNIPAIKSCVESLCRKYGKRIEDQAADGGFYYAFPSAEALAGALDEDLRTCSLGYRAPYIKATAIDAAADPEALYRMAEMTNEELLDALMRFKGVGVKVANCVSLFAYHRIDAFPVDVWISRMLEQYYPDGFPFERYSGFAGVMQQYMFFHAVSNK
ncbi:MAG: DNA-3-methyladenine glycosylase 2 family protein [Lachnospiraceae bacterium]|nr:DNA-3-methyladenine glycosylase 2 family protein [Lachnospiraceae bacterium]